MSVLWFEIWNQRCLLLTTALMKFHPGTRVGTAPAGCVGVPPGDALVVVETPPDGGCDVVIVGPPGRHCEYHGLE